MPDAEPEPVVPTHELVDAAVEKDCTETDADDQNEEVVFHGPPAAARSRATWCSDYHSPQAGRNSRDAALGINRVVGSTSRIQLRDELRVEVSLERVAAALGAVA